MTRGKISITVGIGLFFSLLLIFLLGFVARSSRDVLLVVLGYALGLLAVLANDQLKLYAGAEKQRTTVRSDERE